MTTTQKIPERRWFKLIELKKKWRIRTAKIAIHGDFDDVIVNQRIVMIYDFSKQIAEIEEAEKELAAEKYNSQNRLLDTDDENSILNATTKLQEKVDAMKRRLEAMKLDHADFIFLWKVVEHKLKYTDWWPSTEVVYNVEKKSIDRLDEMSAHLPNYEMMIVDHNERLASQKTWMLETIAEEVKEEKTFWWPIKVSNIDLLEKDDSSFVLFQKIFERKFSEAKLAKECIQVFDSLALLYKWKINDLKVILEWCRYDLERIKETTNSEKSILLIALDEAVKQDTWMWKMLLLASAFDFTSILSKYE